MAVETLPDGTKTKPTADPLTPAEQAQLDRIEAGLRDQQRQPANRTAQAKKAAGFIKKNKKWFVGGGVGLGFLVPILLFFFWIMLFKNVHIRNLYVAHRWAQFNRGLSKSLKEELTSAKEDGVTPNGSEDSVIPDDAPPEDIIKEANKSEVGSEVLDPADDAKLTEEARRGSTSLQSVDEGVTKAALDAVDVDPTIKEATSEPGKSDAEVQKGAIEKEIADGGNKDTLKDPKGKIGDGVKEAKDIASKEGVDAKTAASKAADSVLSGGSGFAETVQKATGPFVIATFYCIFRDIYVSSKEQINKIIIGGVMNVSEEVNKTADGQKLGKVSLDRAGQMANRFDDGKESFTETCGYTRATQSSNPECKDINPQFVINKVADRVGGAGGAGIKIADQVLDMKSFKVTFPGTNIGPKVGPEQVCPVIMNTWVQGGVAVANLTAIVLSDGSWGAAGQAIVTGAGAAFATAGGKALIAHAIMAYSGTLFKDLGPHDFGNLTDMGNLATASGACRAAGCVKTTPQQQSMLNRQYREERIALNKKRSTLEKFFDTNSTDSLATRVALNTPTTPSAIIGRIKTVVASITNPLALNRSVGNTTLALAGNTALASDSLDDNPYGIATYAPANLVYNYDAKQTDSFYKSLSNEQKSALEATYNTCNNTEKKSVIEGIANQNIPDECNAEDYHKYASYKFTQKSLFAWATSHNNQTKLGSNNSASSAPSGTVAVDVKKSIDTSAQTCPTGTTDKGISKAPGDVSIRLCDVGGGIKVNVSMAGNYYSLVQAAKTDGLALSGGGYRDSQGQIAARRRNCGTSDYAIYKMPSRDCKVPTAIPGRSNHEYGLAVDFDNASFRSTAVYIWLAAHAKDYKIYNLPKEPWHWSVDGQ